MQIYNGMAFQDTGSERVLKTLMEPVVLFGLMAIHYGIVSLARKLRKRPENSALWRRRRTRTETGKLKHAINNGPLSVLLELAD